MAATATLLTCLSLGGIGSAIAAAEPADLQVDGNRDGRIDPADTPFEDFADTRSGALFLPNLDDDSHRCADNVKAALASKIRMRMWGMRRTESVNRRLHGCSDATDKAVNGAADAEDLARLRIAPMPGVSDAAAATISVTGKGAAKINLFANRDGRWQLVRAGDVLPAAVLRAGLELGIESTDIVRDAKTWDGTVGIDLSVEDGPERKSDSVRMRVAPLLTHDHLQATQAVLASPPRPVRPGKAKGGTAGLSSIRGRPVSKAGTAASAADRGRFGDNLGRATAAAGVPLHFLTGDQWTQDFVEPMYSSIPAAGGTHGMRLLMRSHQMRDFAQQSLFRLLGPGIGIVRAGPSNDFRTVDSMGNLETIPPYTRDGIEHPAGRIVLGRQRGRWGKPSPKMRTLLNAQDMQRPLMLDTDWLRVGHVDEFMQFLPAPGTERGWRLAIADPDLGIDILRRASAAGHGGVKTLSFPFGNPRHARKVPTIDQALADPRFRRANRFAAARIAANVSLIRAETGLADTEILRVPALFEGKRRLGAYVPGAVNNLLISPDRVLVARQWGPGVDGEDLFGVAVSETYAGAGIAVSYIDDFTSYHIYGGEVHCGTNSLRDISFEWWDI
ncbi:MAG TPA: protein-arginine deiminase family protein [Solirubrobacterales bacterium]|nr:protein-arginine deiminase family protein [Solirubrobacterales bacterium]